MDGVQSSVRPRGVSGAAAHCDADGSLALVSADRAQTGGLANDAGYRLRAKIGNGGDKMRHTSAACFLII